MISGVVTDGREAVIRLTIEGPFGQRERIQAVLDTGFDGWLSVPPDMILRLRLPWQRRGLAELADGSPSLFDIYEATVTWDRRRLRIPVDEANAMPLVGMALMEGYTLNMQIRPGGKVTLTRLSR